MPKITELPTPPSSNDTSNFDDRADAFLLALPKFAEELNEYPAKLWAYCLKKADSLTEGQSEKINELVSRLDTIASRLDESIDETMDFKNRFIFGVSAFDVQDNTLKSATNAPSSYAIIPNGITSIAERAFNASTIMNFYFTKEVQELKAPGANPPYTFYDASLLKSVVFERGIVLKDLSSAFVKCTALEKIALPEGVEDIMGSFVFCQSLKEISLPKSLKDASAAFKGCASLERIVMKEHTKEEALTLIGNAQMPEKVKVVCKDGEFESKDYTKEKICPCCKVKRSGNVHVDVNHQIYVYVFSNGAETDGLKAYMLPKNERPTPARLALIAHLIASGGDSYNTNSMGTNIYADKNATTIDEEHNSLCIQEQNTSLINSETTICATCFKAGRFSVSNFSV